MAAFRDRVSDNQRLDFDLLQHGPVALYFRNEVLDGAIAWFREHHYDIKTTSCATWRGNDDMHDALTAMLGFPDHYGRNGAALNDCVSDLDVREDSGLVLVFSRYDAFAQANRDVAQFLLDVLASNARTFLLCGRRLIVLVQSDDPRITFDPVGASPVNWNGAEWLDAKRGL
jgi:RNAse (barnase) inhibitor barstar